MRFLTNSVWDVASLAFCGVLDSRSGGGPAEDLGGVGVCNLISSLEITLSASNGVRPAPRKPALILCSVKVAWNAVLNAGKNSALVIWDSDRIGVDSVELDWTGLDLDGVD
jgi:hypothetical protein